MLRDRIYQLLRKNSYLIRFNFAGFISGIGYFIGAETASLVVPVINPDHVYISILTILSGEFLSSLFYLLGFYYLFRGDYGSFLKSAPDAVKHLRNNITPIVASQIVFFIAHFHLQGVMHASIAMPISGLFAFVAFNLVRNALYRFYPMPNHVKNKLKMVKRFIKREKSTAL